MTVNVTGKVYQYMEIIKSNINDTDVSSVKIRFIVNKTWMAENNVSKNNVSPNRWEATGWRKLNTTIVSEGSTEITYEAESPGSRCSQ